MDEHFVAAGGRHQAAIQWVLWVFQNGMNHLLAAGLMRQGCDYHLSEQHKAIPVRCLKPPGSEETRPQSTWFWKPSERTVWATPNRLPLAQAVTQSCENKTSSRKSWSPCQIGVCPKENDNGARCYRATIPRSNSWQNPYLRQAGLWLQPTH